MNWVRKKSLLAIKSISYENCSCNTLPDLWNALHNSYNSAENRPVNTRFLNKLSQANVIEWLPFSNQEFKDAIAKYSSSSTPGPDYVLWRHIKSLISYNTCLERLVHIANAYIKLEYWSFHFKSANTIVIPKPNKTLHNTLSFFQPIILLNTTGKLVKKVISNRPQFHMSATSFLDPNQLGGIRQRSTTDAGIYLTYLICTEWLKQCHTSIIAFDITQFFSSFNHKFLFTCLKKAGLNTNIIGFFNSYYSNCSTTYT